MDKMFTNKDRIVTPGILQALPDEIIAKLWEIIDTMMVSKKDYVQQFSIKNEWEGLSILHTQEAPPYGKSHFVPSMEFVPGNQEVFAIDDGNVCTMMLASER